MIKVFCLIFTESTRTINRYILLFKILGVWKIIPTYLPSKHFNFMQDFQLPNRVRIGVGGVFTHLFCVKALDETNGITNRENTIGFLTLDNFIKSRGAKGKFFNGLQNRRGETQV